MKIFALKFKAHKPPFFQLIYLKPNSIDAFILKVPLFSFQSHIVFFALKCASFEYRYYN